MKKGTIKNCVYTGDWKAPNGTTLYYHEITLDNGDIGSVAKKTMNPPDIAIGKEIEYTQEGKKIKLAQAESSGGGNGGGGNKFNKKSYKAKPTDFLGYSYAYAKDMVVAGKTKPEDLKDLKRIAEGIYDHIVDLIDKHEQK